MRRNRPCSSPSQRHSPARPLRRRRAPAAPGLERDARSRRAGLTGVQSGTSLRAPRAWPPQELDVMCAPAAAQYSRQRTAALVTRCPSRPAMALQPSSRTPPATPATPSALLATAPTVPAQCVPWPSASCGARPLGALPCARRAPSRELGAHPRRPRPCSQRPPRPPRTCADQYYIQTNSHVGLGGDACAKSVLYRPPCRSAITTLCPLESPAAYKPSALPTNTANPAALPTHTASEPQPPGRGAR